MSEEKTAHNVFFLRDRVFKTILNNIMEYISLLKTSEKTTKYSTNKKGMK